MKKIIVGILIGTCAFLVGCWAHMSSRRLDSLPGLPGHWHHLLGQGIDTEVGCFWSDELSLNISYDIGIDAGEFVGESAPPAADWVRVDSFQGVEYRNLLSDEFFVITIPSEGPANYVARVSSPDEIDYVLELVLKYRAELLRLESARRSPNMNPCDL